MLTRLPISHQVDELMVPLMGCHCSALQYNALHVVTLKCNSLNCTALHFSNVKLHSSAFYWTVQLWGSYNITVHPFTCLHSAFLNDFDKSHPRPCQHLVELPSADMNTECSTLRRSFFSYPMLHWIQLTLGRKHRENRKTLPREHLISCQGVKMFLLKDPFKVLS